MEKSMGEKLRAAESAGAVREFLAAVLQGESLVEDNDTWASNLTQAQQGALDNLIGLLRDTPSPELLEAAWGVIANAHGGDWGQASPAWRDAAERWRDQYHKTLPVAPKGAEEPAPSAPSSS